MKVNHVLEVQNSDALATVREFLSAWWENYRPETLLAPVEQDDSPGVSIQVVKDSADLNRVNPFAPFMPCNSASIAHQLLQENAGKRMAVILRPCELRTYVELQKRQRRGARHENAVIISVDCLGTYSMPDFKRFVKSRGASAMTNEALQNAAEGGLRAQRVRTACQICDWPAPRGADITIGTIGVPSDKYILVIARDEKTDTALGLDVVAARSASEYQVSHRETVVGAIADAHAGMRRTMIEDMEGTSRFDDLGSILAWIAGCSLCGECLQACPLYDEEFVGLINRHSATPVGRTPLGDVVSLSRWLASCAGCGMCEEECNKHVPLFLLISALSHRIRDKMAYRSGDPAQPPPWISA